MSFENESDPDFGSSQISKRFYAHPVGIVSWELFFCNYDCGAMGRVLALFGYYLSFSIF